MITKQVSVFLENKSGRLNDVTQILGEAGINISAFTIADTSDFGILRLIVTDPEKAKKVLREKSFSVQTTDVVLVQTQNEPGSLSKMLQILSDGGVFIEYMYAFSMEGDVATIVIRSTNIQKCEGIIQTCKDDLMSQGGEYLA